MGGGLDAWSGMSDGDVGMNVCVFGDGREKDGAKEVTHGNESEQLCATRNTARGER